MCNATSSPPIELRGCYCGESGQFAVRAALEHLTRLLIAWGIDADRCAVFELVAAEVLNNVMEHACRGEDGIPFQAWAISEDGALVFKVLDDGAPMPASVVANLETGHAPLPRTDDSVQALPEGGWGWCLIHELSEKIEYVRDNGANHLHIHLNI